MRTPRNERESKKKRNSEERAPSFSAVGYGPWNRWVSQDRKNVFSPKLFPAWCARCPCPLLSSLSRLRTRGPPFSPFRQPLAPKRRSARARSRISPSPFLLSDSINPDNGEAPPPSPWRKFSQPSDQRNDAVYVRRNDISSQSQARFTSTESPPPGVTDDRY